MIAYLPFIEQVKRLTAPITCKCLGKEFEILVEYDKIADAFPPQFKIIEPRVYIQLKYESECTRTGEIDEWKGRKWYLSQYMTDDEIVKTCYAAFKAAVEHEIMEGFKFDGTIVFNPHVSYAALMSVSDREVKRQHN